ncbi:MAG: transcriptional repressor LexA [Oscillospiraceae bacterium]|nr:transcriptional repressor LexA [Oscillospiraceae bacterium]
MRYKNKENYAMIIDFVNRYYSGCGRSPSTREISDGTGISRPTVQRYLIDMREQGEIEYDGHRYIVTDFTRELQADASNRVGIVGSIPCGAPNEPGEDETEYIRLPVELTGKGSFYLLRAHGDSMIAAGIDDGDLVLIRCQACADSGQIVAALIDGEKTTLKRYYPEKNRIILHPENMEYEDIIIKGNLLNSFRIQGVAIKVFKDLR